MQLPSGRAQIIRAFRIVEREQLKSQFLDVFRLYSSLRTGAEKSLQPAVPEAFYHCVKCSDTRYIGQGGKKSRWTGYREAA
jgi:hypothetical protein